MAARAEVIRAAQHGKALPGAVPSGRRGHRPALADLDAEQRCQVIDVFTGLLEGLYAHLPLKLSMYAVDPVQRLRLLKQHADTLEPLDFHNELAAIITGLRDAHTRYIGPSALAGQAAMLPFLVEGYGPAGSPRYIVSKIAEDRVAGRQ